jgi:hypothetical protein
VNFLKRLKDTIGTAELPPKLIWIVSLLFSGVVTVSGYRIEVSIIGRILLFLIVAAAAYAALYWWQKKKQTDPKRHDKGLVRRLSSASSNLSAIWRPLTQFTNIPKFDEAFNEFLAAGESFIFDTELGPKILRLNERLTRASFVERQLKTRAVRVRSRRPKSFWQQSTIC